MRIPVIISLFSLMIITLSSCKKDEKKIYVPDHVKAMAPYSNGQSISFRNGSGQVVNAVISIVSTFTYSSACGSNACHPNNEMITYTFNAGSSKFIVLTLLADTYISGSIYSPLTNFQIPGGFSIIVEPGKPKGSCFAQGQACLPSITLNGKTFIDVLEITVLGSASSLDKVYHTVSQGIVGFKYTNGTTYNLE